MKETDAFKPIFFVNYDDFVLRENENKTFDFSDD